MPAPIVIDLYSDWINLLEAMLIDAGYKVASSVDPLQIAIQYFNVRQRNVEQRARTVQVAKDLACPSELQPALDEIFRKARAGENLTPHLSRKLIKADYHDPLLNDWGLHHIHLGLVAKADGFVERTGPLLFARVTESALYAVAILPHGKGHDPWTDPVLLEAVLANWPSLLDPYRALGIARPELSTEQRKTLRAKRMNSLIELSDGNVYFPPGGGVNSAGSSIHTVSRHDFIANKLQTIETDFRNNLEIRRAELPPGCAFGDPPTFSLAYDDTGPVILERTAKVCFRIEL